jgi:hypothetical protein
LKAFRNHGWTILPDFSGEEPVMEVLTEQVGEKRIDSQ